MKTLLEAAAEVLSGSQSRAPKEEMHKTEAPEDLGGVTPMERIPDSAPVAKNTKKATAPGKSPNVAAEPLQKAEEPEVVKDFGGLKKEEVEAKDKKKDEDDLTDDEKEDEDDLTEDEDEEDEEDEKDKKDEKEKIKEDVNAILASEKNLSEDFRSKVATIYEARVQDKIAQITEKIEAKYVAKLKELTEEITTSLAERTDNFLAYVVEEWMKQNEVAIQTGLRTEITEDFIAGMKTLFAEHYIDIPEDKIDVMKELTEKVETLQRDLNDSLARNIEINSQMQTVTRGQIVESVSDGLTDTQKEKIRTLAERVEFSGEEEFRKQIQGLRQNYFLSAEKKAVQAEQLTEQIEETAEEKKIFDTQVKAVAAALDRGMRQ